MKKLNNKGFTLVELLAVIVVLAIVMGLAVVGISSVLDNTRKSAFAADAKSFIQGARSLVASDQTNAMLGLTTKYSPKCTGTVGATDAAYIPLSAIPLDNRTSSGVKSPYGNYYVESYFTDTVRMADGKTTSDDTNYTTILNDTKQASYIRVMSTVTASGCDYTYSIYLTDGVHYLSATTVGGTTAASSDTNHYAIAENSVEGNNVQ